MTTMTNNILDGVQPVNTPAIPATQNISYMTKAAIPPAMTAAALASSVAGRDCLTEGMAGYEVQRLYNQLAAIELELRSLGPRPQNPAAVPGLSDPTSPFGGKSIGELLRDSGMALVHVQSEATRLRHMSEVLPALRRGLMAASGSSRKAAYDGALIAARAVVAELEQWGPAVLESAEVEPAVRQYDAIKHNIEQRIVRGKQALARLSGDAVAAYQVAVTTAQQAKEIADLQAQLAAKKK